MARPTALGDDSVLNMTPMIDVCFQLIIFFLLTLHFPSASNRFETQLPRRGPDQRPEVLEPLQQITVKLFRKDTEKAPDQHFTRVRVGELATVDFPRGPWPAGEAAEQAREARELACLRQVSTAIGAAWEHQGRNAKVSGEIKTPPPTGALVPHGDVMRVLDAFLEAGLAQVDFEGAPMPR